MTPKHKGVRLELGGETYIVPPLSLGAIELFEEQIETIDTLPLREQARIIADIVHSALVRNYPDLTVEALKELLDVSTMFDAFESVMDVAGLRRKAQEAGEAAGAAG